MTNRHSQFILDHLREYDSFLDGLKVIADFGCGTGEDIAWWATLETRDDPPEPYNYNCFAVDRDPHKLAQVPDLPNVFKYNRDFTQLCLPTKTDLLFSHDALQYSTNPIHTLAMWNSMMNVNGMLVLSVPQHAGLEDNRYYSRTYNGCYFNFTPTNLIYMLAVNGFDCRDAYLLKKFNDPWINMAVYKSEKPPMDPVNTTWADLVETGLLHNSIVESVNNYGYLRQEDIVMPWLDKENYYIDYVSQWTEIPKDVETKIDGVFNDTTESKTTSVQQAKRVIKETPLATPVGVLRTTKKRSK